MARNRSNSIQKALAYVADAPNTHSMNDLKPEEQNKHSVYPASPAEPTLPYRGVVHDIITFQWLTRPATIFRVICSFLAIYGLTEYFYPAQNPLHAFLMLSYALEPVPGDEVDTSLNRPLAKFFGKNLYEKGPLDICFLLFYIIVFSFIRQFSTEHIWKPLGQYFGITRNSKISRFVEQGYSLQYFSFFAFLGIAIMYGLPIWWYNTSAFWLEYPHWKMTPELKIYYLLQLSYWIQQCFVMVLGLEKPRPDFVELIAHHIVTLWLIIWSYSISLTYIGVAVFVSMDISDAFLSKAKLLNYLGLQRASDIAFVVFLVVWTYFRHYLNIVILHSVWTEYDHLVPPAARFFKPSEGVWLAGWMKYQIFVPLLLIQLLNMFWYYLIMRILFRILTGNNAVDVREENESDDEDEGEDVKKTQ